MLCRASQEVDTKLIVPLVQHCLELVEVYDELDPAMQGWGRTLAQVSSSRPCADVETLSLGTSTFNGLQLQAGA